MQIVEKSLQGFEFKLENESNVSYINDKDLKKKAKKLVENVSKKFKGNYCLFNLYLNKEGHRYGLIYADIDESEVSNIQEAEKINHTQLLQLHQMLKTSGLHLDYFFVMTYYDHIDRKAGSCLISTALSHEVY